MAHRTCIHRVCLVAGLITASAAVVSAQSRPAPFGDVRTSFAGFAWGATDAEITAARGQPAKDTLMDDYRQLVYRDTTEASGSETWYLLHPTRGLMAGQRNFPKPEKCLDTFKAIRRDLEHENPGLKKSDELKRNLDLACSMAAGKIFGSWLLAWGDSGSARIQQMMMTGAPSIIVFYRGPDADAYIKEQREQRGVGMDGFASLKWGTPRDSVLKRLGTPKQTDSIGDLVKLSYFDLLLSERTIVEFGISRVDGLISGTYWVPVPVGQDCELFFRKFHFALLERFPGIKPQVARVDPYKKSFCQGLADGTASLRVSWQDPKSDALVSLELNKPGKFVKLWYRSAQYPAWANRNRTTDVKSKL